MSHSEWVFATSWDAEYVNYIIMSRGLRNNNPGNIRQSGVKYVGEVRPSQDKSFKQFETMAHGYRAMFVLLDSYRRNGYKTLRQMINRYAPPVENYTDKYMHFVAEWAGVAPDDWIDTTNKDKMVKIVAAMSKMENGVTAVPADVLAGWQMFENRNA